MINHARSYFENGCICIKQKKFKKCSDEKTDLEAVTFYEDNCKCYRNYTK